MSNLETRPRESACGAQTPGEAVTEMLEPRKVWLGKTTQVRRLLPHKERRMVGAWCFVDHYGPDDVRDQQGMWVPPHPHTGLQTVSWLFDGEVLHRDSVGSEARVRPGELNLMTAGEGIAHSEESPGDHDPVLHGVQLWVALPDPDRRTAAAAFAQHRDLPVADLGGARATVLVGELAGVRSPAYSFTPLVGAEVSLRPGAPVRVPLTPEHEYAVLVVDGPVTVAGEALDRGQMLYVGRHRDELEMSAAGEGRLMLLGGEPFEEQLVMWWNFIGRTHEEVVEAREQWMAGLDAGRDDRFGVVHGFAGEPLPAPEMPTTRLRPRGRTRRV
ncbi:MAG: pirin family protein [Actinomycetota bacterium]|nr:pirin family protein [Actinomycetota bacterium]